MPRKPTAPAAPAPTVAAKPAESVEKPNKSRKKAEAPKEVKYKERVNYEHVGDNAMPATEGTHCAAAILGWEELAPGDRKHAMLMDFNGKPVRLKGNLSNRFIDMNWVMTLAYIILNRKWQYNYQPILVSKYGNVIDGQHRLVALVIAQQIREHPDHKDDWDAKGWGDQVTIDALVIYGTEENSELTSTVGYARPKTIADVLYCQEEVFSSLQPGKIRADWAKALSVALDRLWDRTARNEDANDKDLTNVNVVDFYRAHKKLSEYAVKEIMELCGKTSRLEDVVGHGTAAGLLILMAGTTTPWNEYANDRTEKSIRSKDLAKGSYVNANNSQVGSDIFERGCEFWKSIATSGAKQVEAIFDCLSKKADKLTKAGKQPTINSDFRIALVVKAWNIFFHIPISDTTTPLKVKDIMPEEVEVQDMPGVWALAEFPKITDGEGNGIDRGSHNQREEDIPIDTPAPQKGDAQEADIEARKAAILAEKGHGDRAGDDETPEQERKRREANEAAVVDGAAKPATVKKGIGAKKK